MPALFLLLTWSLTRCATNCAFRPQDLGVQFLSGGVDDDFLLQFDEVGRDPEDEFQQPFSVIWLRGHDLPNFMISIVQIQSLLAP